MTFDKTVQQYLQESEQTGPPYIIKQGGASFYYKDPDHSILHREDGPAIVWSDGRRSWWINGDRHREDGPAVIYADGSKNWWVNGKKLTEDEFNEHLNRCDIKKEIQGHKNNRIDPGMLEDYL